MTDLGIFVGGLALFVVGLHSLRAQNDVRPAAANERQPRMGVAGLRWVRLEGAAIGTIGLFVMLVATML